MSVIRRSNRQRRSSGYMAASAMPGRRRSPQLVVLATVIWVLAGCGLAQGSLGPAGSGAGATVAASAAPVVRTVLAAGLPTAAPGQNLELVHYTIAPHTQLAPHHHPGMQLALIESGLLTYSVIEGTILIHAVDGLTRTIGPGETGTIAAGEWLAETESIVHFGANDTDSPVVILAASLLEADEPPAIPVSPAPAG